MATTKNGKGKMADVLNEPRMKGGGKDEVVRLVELEPKRLKVTVVGTSPYISHAWSIKAIRLIEAKQQQEASEPRGARSPEEEFEASFYTDGQGRRCIPARAFKKAMVSAATSINDKRFPKTLIRQVLFVEGDLLPVRCDSEPSMRTDMVGLPRSGAEPRYRPEFPPGWEVDIVISYNGKAVSAEQIVNLLNLAGFAVGVGDWRPEKDGNNGRFTVKRSE